jgi:hypothetical protein
VTCWFDLLADPRSVESTTHACGGPAWPRTHRSSPPLAPAIPPSRLACSPSVSRYGACSDRGSSHIARSPRWSNVGATGLCPRCSSSSASTSSTSWRPLSHSDALVVAKLTASTGGITSLTRLFRKTIPLRASDPSDVGAAAVPSRGMGLCCGHRVVTDRMVWRR